MSKKNQKKQSKTILLERICPYATQGCKLPEDKTCPQPPQFGEAIGMAARKTRSCSYAGLFTQYANYAKKIVIIKVPIENQEATDNDP